MKRIPLLIFILTLSAPVAYGRIFTGQVLDSANQKPVPFANVYVVELQSGAVTDTNGIFSLPLSNSGKVHFQISCVGYQARVYIVNLSLESQKIFFLSESHLHLNEIVVSASSVKLQQDNIVAVIQKSITELNRNSPSNLSEAISNIPGIDNNSTGTGIGKPVIRGLSGNRIVVYAQNVRIENQQWGGEHGLGIGDIGIENVEVIKGASSLLYGSDALGGVLFFVDERYATMNSIQGFISTKFISSMLSTNNSAGIKLNKNGFRVNAFGNYNSSADYLLPDFNRAGNTRFNEAGFKTSIVYNYKKWIGNIRYSFLQNNFGITENDTPSVSTERFPELPYQKIDNHLIGLDNIFFLGKTKLYATIGYNINDRKEFEELVDLPALHLKLSTYTYNLRCNNSFFNDKLILLTGVQGMFQQNLNLAEEILIPDASVTDAGVFAVLHYSPFKKLNFEGGIRFDNRNISTSEMQTPETYFPELNRNFYNFNYALGASYQIKKFLLKVNVASGFRAPNTSELLSNGVHEGALRYEIGNNALKSENALQADISLNFEQEHFSFYVNPFLNHINNYIYLAPSDSVVEDAPVFYYRQTAANLLGGEAGFHWHPHPVDWLHFESNYSSVFGFDKYGNSLPLIPANKIQTTIKGEFKTKGKIKFESVFVEHIYRFRQNRTAVFESVTSDYHLLNAGLVFMVKSKGNIFEITTGIKNILNTNYIDHLSRFKTMSIPNSGINPFIALKWQFDVKIN
jgi:iron complex outermembrane recepter protein